MSKEQPTSIIKAETTITYFGKKTYVSPLAKRKPDPKKVPNYTEENNLKN